MSQTCPRCYRIVPRACQTDTETMDCPNLKRPANGPFRGPERFSRKVEPSGTLLIDGRPYEPSWQHAARISTTWTDALAGHLGLCGHLRPLGDAS